ncbi:MAG: hypothetical protein KA500_01040 [Rhodoluna sp.]|nr:hypothetical protein [Rhodoluna sp.]MBP6186166.1 hypothetical protein [Rhodoluna sp.]
MASAFFDPDDFDVPAPVAAPVNVQPVTTMVQEDKRKFFDLKPVAAAPALEVAKIEVAAEPIRMPEPLSLPTEFPSFAAPEGFTVDLSDLGIGSDEPLTRRQLREMQRLTGSDDIAQAAETELETELPYDDDLVEQLPQLEATEFEVPAATADDFSYLNNQVESMFDVSPGLVVEPTTNSIMMDQVQDLTNYTATISETGEILTTGAIQLPIELTDNSTGEIQIIQEAAALDSAIQVDNATGFINTIAPMRVTGVVNAVSKFKVIPTNLKRGSSHPYLVLAAAIGMVALGSLVVAAFWLRII